MKKVLVTGSSGFIGYHLSLFLKKRKDQVIGLDNFNAYYDPHLKKNRAKILEEAGIPIIVADINDQSRLASIFEKEKITHCVHLAAQAGVRHSMLEPKEYVHSNLAGFVSLLEVCRLFPHVRTIFASSSSVYGLNEKIPFSTEDPTDKPANLYGATKKANELIAHAYHHLYKIPLIGLRYFTVYGPWGRPDMAYFLFTRNILEGKPIPVFNCGKMKRDFTYIDDIIRGTASALDVPIDFDIFNLGNNHPISLLEFIAELEDALGKKADKEMLPMQKGDVLETCADISKSQKQLHFSPSIPLKEGIRHFVHWYREYYKVF
jgi:UDP-glucuronate 4-epimerase